MNFGWDKLRKLLARANTWTGAQSFTDLDVAGDFTVGATTRITMGGGVDDDGIVFGSLGTATKAIDLSATGLSGTSDYQLYLGTNDWWAADGVLKTHNDIMRDGNIIIRQLGGDNSISFQSPYAVRLRSTSGYDAILDAQGTGNNIANLDSLTAFFAGKQTAVGSLTNCTSAVSAVITKTAHGLTPSAGDLLHITDSATAADEGFYQVQSYATDTITVDRALTAIQTNVDLTIYEDVVGFFTDADGNIRITGYQSDDEPLQIGGLTHVGAGGHSLGAEDVLIGGKLEVDGATFLDDDITLAADKHLVLPIHNEAATPTLAFGDGDTGFYESADDEISIAFAATQYYLLSSGAFRSATATGAFNIDRTASSATNPSYCFTSDADTGIGRAAADQLSLIAGGFEGLRIVESGNVVNMNIVCYDDAIVCYEDEVLTYSLT